MYGCIDFPVAIGENGDCFDRYLIRIHEMYISNYIIQKGLEFFNDNFDEASLSILSDSTEDELLDKKIK